MPPAGRALKTQAVPTVLMNHELGSSIVLAKAMEMSDMPPPIVPVIFSFAILVAAGALQMSLGDVMSEEADLGISSGANARKEMERKNNSYFKKGPSSDDV
eukprot:CAMPEP_0172585376 /NCGR_PEP_ID=MMETSP1068-20121228/4801_1 /TAXON_ID=35684 /ORGANISM="Pseudopedinella elastica, Strain CCMP716" /LENGTH=100 /DNA_ID=CAMNT_0013379811 /DNA_START=165 /DNA_END=467 /DNA_ORIENTATION=+